MIEGGLTVFRWLDEFGGGPSLYILASWIGMLLCGVAASATKDRQCQVPNSLYQASFIVIAFALGWGTVYGNDRAWAPWPPHFWLVIAVDLFLALRVCRAIMLWRRDHPEAPTLSLGSQG